MRGKTLLKRVDENNNQSTSIVTKKKKSMTPKFEWPYHYCSPAQVEAYVLFFIGI